MSYNKDEVKNKIEIEDVYNLLDYFDAEPQMFSTYIISKTICHGGHSHKLYYYENTQLFKCFTGGCGTFDIFELVQKVQNIDDLNQAIYFVVNFFNLQSQLSDDTDFDIEDYKILANNKKLLEIESYNKEKILLPEYPELILNYPQPRILNWEEEGISYDICKYMGIKYDPVNGAICNHPLAFNLYGFDRAKSNIQNMQVAIIVESEKSVMQYQSYFGIKNNICVAVCGSSISRYQLQLLLDAGVKEIVLGFDKDFQEMHSKEYDDNIKKIDRLYAKISSEVSVSVLFDQYNLLGYKNSPLDCGKDAFLYLWRHRIIS